MSENDLFDRRQTRLARARGATSGEHFLLARTIADLTERIGEVNRPFSAVLEISPRPGGLAEALGSDGAVLASVTPIVAAPSDSTTVIDEEWVPFAPGSFDLVASALTLHTVNDLPGALIQINRALRPDGLFIAAMFGGETLKELREALTAAEAELTGGAAPRVIPFTELAEAGRLMQRAGFSLPVVDTDRITVRYADPLALMRDLRAMGETNALSARSRTPLSRDVVMRAGEIYCERFADADGRLRATFDIVTMTGWRAHESQQKPLAPGSARTRLADALGTSERTAGDRARPGQPSDRR